jgi:hypothetical protein
MQPAAGSSEGVDGMTNANHAESKERAAPETETVTTRVNVAFPFSQIKVQEPSEDLVALAALMRELVDLVAEVAPGSKAQDLRKRARALATRLQ